MIFLNHRCLVSLCGLLWSRFGCLSESCSIILQTIISCFCESVQLFSETLLQLLNWVLGAFELITIFVFWIDQCNLLEILNWLFVPSQTLINEGNIMVHICNFKWILVELHFSQFGSIIKHHKCDFRFIQQLVKNSQIVVAVPSHDISHFCGTHKTGNCFVVFIWFCIIRPNHKVAIGKFIAFPPKHLLDVFCVNFISWNHRVFHWVQNVSHCSQKWNLLNRKLF